MALLSGSRRAVALFVPGCRGDVPGRVQAVGDAPDQGRDGHEDRWKGEKVKGGFKSSRKSQAEGAVQSVEESVQEVHDPDPDREEEYPGREPCQHSFVSGAHGALYSDKRAGQPGRAGGGVSEKIRRGRSVSFGWIRSGMLAEPLPRGGTAYGAGIRYSAPLLTFTNYFL